MSFSKALCPHIGIAGDELRLPRHFGGVIVVGVLSQGMNMFLASRVMKARKEYKIEPPIMYSLDNMKYNCIQRAHQNYLEQYPTFLMFLFVGGLGFPRAASVCGLIYLVGRYLYYRGYSTGDPKKRMQGAIAYLGFFPLLFMTVAVGASHLKKSLA